MALAFEKIEIDSDIILIESDLIFEPSILKKLIRSPYPTAALVDRFRSGMDGTVVTVDNTVITTVIPPHVQGENFDFADKYKTLNIYKFSKKFCETSFHKLLTYYARTINDNCYYELILGILIYMQQDTIHAVIVDNEKWAEVDDPNDLRVADFVFNSRRVDMLKDAFGGYWNFDVLDFVFIRNMHFPGSAIISEMKNNLANLIHNYGSRQLYLDTKMSWFLLCNVKRLIALNGASQIYPVLAHKYAGKKALIPRPAFGEYPRIFPNASLYTDEVGMDTAEIEKKAKKHDVVVIVNPNNPTGSVVSTEWIWQCAQQNPSADFIIDESFIEFSSQTPLLSILETRPLDNVIVVKSLSKSLGMPGIRLGYAYTCNSDIADYIHTSLPIWSMNSLAEFALETMLKHRRSLAQSFELTKNDRDDFIEQLRDVPAIETVYPSEANFILLKLAPHIKADTLVHLLVEKYSIYIKDVSDKFDSAKQYIRLAVRTADENAKLIACLREAAADTRKR